MVMHVIREESMKDATWWSSPGILLSGGQELAFVVTIADPTSRIHLEKHKKPYKCEIEGCSNMRGFARSDQLRRHYQEVHHLQP